MNRPTFEQFGYPTGYWDDCQDDEERPLLSAREQEELRRDRRLNEAQAAVNGYLTHYGFAPLEGAYLWEEALERIHLLLRHMEDVLPAPAPKKVHPIYWETDK